MQDDLRKQVIAELQKEHGDAFIHCSDQAYAGLERALGWVPDDASWMIATPLPTVFARAESTLFTVSLDVKEDRVLLISRPVEAKKLAVALEMEKPIDKDGMVVRPTKWTFCESDNAEDQLLCIQGKITIHADGREVLDRSEQFARSLAVSGGWSAHTSPRFAVL